MSDHGDSIDMMFYSLVLSLQASAMQHLGKVISPVTGKVERNLEAAKHTVEMLEMIRRKTDGNLTDDERQTLEHILYELRLNYVDEVKKGKEEPTRQEAGDSTSKATADTVEKGPQTEDQGN